MIGAARSRRGGRAAAALLAASASVAGAGPADVLWVAPGSGVFQTGSNWLGGMAPGAGQRAAFEGGAARTVSLNAGVTNAGLSVRAGATLDLDLAGWAYALTDANSLVVGERAGEGAALTVRGGALSGANVEVGRLDGASGTLALAGMGARISAAADLFAGRGDGASGSLLVAGGGAATARATYLAYGDDSLGAAVVSGAGSSLTSTLDLVVGQFGAASLDVTGGGFVSAQNVAAGRSSGSRGDLRFNGTGSELFTLFKLSIGSGFGAEAAMRVEDGARARSLFGVIAEFASSAGECVVSGAGAEWEVEDALYVGFRGQGRMEVAAGGRVLSRFAALGRHPGSTGWVSVAGDGSAWIDEQGVDVGAVGPGLSALWVGAGGVVRTAEVRVGRWGELGGDGLIEARVRNEGAHRPGPMPDASGAARFGAAVVVGEYEAAPTSELEMEVGGAGQDALAVSGAAALGGVLRIALEPGFDPALGATWTLVAAGSITGWFDVVETPALAWPKRLVVEQVGDRVEMRVAVRPLSEFGSLLTEEDPVRTVAAGTGGPGVNLGDLALALRSWLEQANQGKTTRVGAPGLGLDR